MAWAGVGTRSAQARLRIRPEIRAGWWEVWSWNHGLGVAAGVTGFGWQLELRAGLAEDMARKSCGLVGGLGWNGVRRGLGWFGLASCAQSHSSRYTC